MKPSIRAATPADIAACIDLRGRTRENAVPAARLAALGITEASWSRDVQDDTLPGQVCVTHAGIVGYCFGSALTGEVVVLALLPAFEGMGLGKALLRIVMRDLAGRGHARLYLGCSADPRHRSHGFYRHLGWRSTGEHDARGDEVLEFVFADPMRDAHAVFCGSGPGIQTRDGCSVELYRQVPYGNELEHCVRYLRPGDRLLELGCGSGRHTKMLLEMGLHVTAVDNSEDMLRVVPDAATKTLGDIETLALDATFDTALLASCLINHPTRRTRTAFVATARRHLDVGGRLLLQRQDPRWLRTTAAGTSGKIGAMLVSVEAVCRAVDPMTMTLRYDLGTEVWRQTFSVVPLEEDEIESMLSSSGFGDFEWLGPRRLWLSAVAGRAPAAG